MISRLKTAWRRLRATMAQDPRIWLGEEIGRLPARDIYDLLLKKLDFEPGGPPWSVAVAELHRYSLERKLVIVPEPYFTPVYSPASVPEEVWSGMFDAGVVYDADAQIAFLRETLRFNSELRELALEPTAAGDAGQSGYYWNNPQFSHADAVIYYSLVRRIAPARIIEIGGGFSTLLAAQAARCNGTTRIDCVEPYPGEMLRGEPIPVHLIAKPVQEIPLEFFDGLKAGDILFYDGSHVCKTGSDVNHVLLRILPRLRAGVWVHIHDIHLPYEYPRSWAEQLYYWNELYLVAALMAHSSKFELVVGVHFLERTAAHALQALLPPVPGLMPGGASYWLKCLR